MKNLGLKEFTIGYLPEVTKVIQVQVMVQTQDTDIKAFSPR